MNKFRLVLQSTEKNLYESEVNSVSLGSKGGDLQVFARHADLSTSFDFTSIKVETDNETLEFYARSGIVNFDNKENKLLVLGLSIEPVAEVDMKGARSYLEYVNSLLENKDELSNFKIVQLENEKIALEKQIQKTPSE